MGHGITEFTSHLEGVKRSSKGYEALCPCHPDHNPSLDLEVKDGKVLFICRIGCAQSDLVAFFRSKGLFSGGARPGSFPEAFKGQMILQRYAYADEDGTVLFHVCRTAGKEFPIHSPEGKWGRNKARLVLYNLPAVLKAESVFLVEGERDVHTLKRMGLVGTTSPGGAGKWKPAFNKCLKGREVIIPPDNDDPGRSHASQVAASLHSIAESVRVLELPNLPIGGDVSDWAKGRDPVDAGEDLCRLADEAETWSPQPADREDTHDDAAGLYDIADLASWPAEPLEPIVPGMLARGQLLNVAGQTQANKSLFSLNLVRRCVEGGDLCGKYPVRPISSALYLVLEDPPRRVKARLEDQAEEFDGLPEPGSLRFDFGEFRLYDPNPGDDQSHFHGLDELEERIIREQIDLIIIDTFQRATPGLESFNDRFQGPRWHRLAQITRSTGATIITLDHFRKQPAGNQKGSSVGLDEVKGSGTKLQNCDGVILLEREGKDRLKLWAMNKDFDDHIGILLEVSGIGQGGPKFTYVEDLEAMGTSRKEVGERNRQLVLEAMIPGEWVSCSDLAAKLDFDHSTVRRHLNVLAETGEVDKEGIGRGTKYCRADDFPSER